MRINMRNRVKIICTTLLIATVIEIGYLAHLIINLQNEKKELERQVASMSAELGDRQIALSILENKVSNLSAQVDYLIENAVIVTPIDIEEQAYYDELGLLAQCVYAEAGNQGKYGMVLVADVILNRVDSPDFPNTITEVIYQLNQFEVVLNGTVDTVDPSDECFEAIKDELVSRSNNEVLYFQTGNYSSYGTPLFQYKSHYFSGRRDK